jgi:hypothetical protein
MAREAGSRRGAPRRFGYKLRHARGSQRPLTICYPPGGACARSCALSLSVVVALRGVTGSNHERIRPRALPPHRSATPTPRARASRRRFSGGESRARQPGPLRPHRRLGLGAIAQAQIGAREERAAAALHTRRAQSRRTCGDSKASNLPWMRGPPFAWSWTYSSTAVRSNHKSHSTPQSLRCFGAWSASARRACGLSNRSPR